MGHKIGIADTTFARVNMGGIAIETIRKEMPDADIERYTVPGFKDLPVACKLLIEKYKCDIVMAFGWVGDKPVDELCVQSAYQGLVKVQLMTNTHVIQCFVHSGEAKSEKALAEIAKDRAVKHALNTVGLLRGKDTLSRYAGRGLRQGYSNEGGI